MSPKANGFRAPGKAAHAESFQNGLGTNNGYDVKLSDSDSASDSDGRRKCGACDRRFWPSFKGQRFCDKACYHASLRSIDSVARFWAKVNKNGPIARPGLTPCWLWTANAVGPGRMHGQFTLPRTPGGGNQRHIYAHRYSWTLANGPIPDGLECLHVCDVGWCVNPEHLFLGTQADNLADARQKGRLDSTAPRPGAGVLTYEDRIAIFEAHGGRGVVAALARRYNVTKTTVSNIRAGRFARRKEQPAQPLAAPVQEPARPFDLANSPFELVPSRQLPVLGEVR